MENNKFKEFWENGTVEYDSKTWMLMVALAAIQAGIAIQDLYQYHKSITTDTGIAKRKWQAAEDEKRLYEKKMKKEFGKDYNFKTDAKYIKLDQEAVALWKIWELMKISKELEKHGDEESKKAEKLKRRKEHIEENY